MSGIPNAAYRHPTVAEAIDRAAAIVADWSASEASVGDARVAEVVGGWTAIALVERIAWALLERQGFDIEGLREAVENCRAGAEADVLGAWPEKEARV